VASGREVGSFFHSDSRTLAWANCHPMQELFGRLPSALGGDESTGFALSMGLFRLTSHQTHPGRNRIEASPTTTTLNAQ